MSLRNPRKRRPQDNRFSSNWIRNQLTTIALHLEARNYRKYDELVDRFVRDLEAATEYNWARGYRDAIKIDQLTEEAKVTIAQSIKANKK